MRLLLLFGVNSDVLKYTASLHHLALAVQSKLATPDSINLLKRGGGGLQIFTPISIDHLKGNIDKNQINRVVYSQKHDLNALALTNSRNIFLL